MGPRTVKKTLAAGKGRLLEFNDNDKAVFDYDILLPLVNVNKEGFPEDKDLYKQIDTTKKPYPNGYGKPLELVFGKKFQMPIMETCLKTMLVDEISQFDVDIKDALALPMVASKLRNISRSEVDKNYKDEHHHHCAAMGPIKTGYPDLDDFMNNPSPIRLIIHLKQYIPADEYKADSWQMNDETKLKAIDQLKDEGNRLFKENALELATEKYREALTILDTLLLKEKPGDTEWTELDKKNVPLYLNLSQCYLNLKRFYEAAGAAEEALKRDPENEKALFRRAKAKIGTWDFDEAEKDLIEMAQKHPESQNLAKKELDILCRKKLEKKQSDKSVYKAMFTAKMSGENK